MVSTEFYNDFKEQLSTNGFIIAISFILITFYPLFTLSIEHWSSGIYSLLGLFSIVYLFKYKKNNRLEHSPELIIYVMIVLLFFISILISSTLNDWTYNSYRRMGMELKILVAVPLLLMLSQYTILRKWFIYSIPLAGIILGIHGILDVTVFDDPYADSAYGKIITGDIAGLLVGLTGVILIYTDIRKLKAICLLAMILVTITCILSTSRNGWIALVINMIFLLILSFKHNKVVTLKLLILVLISVSAATTMMNPKSNIDMALNEFDDFIDKDKRAKIDLRQSSVGYRLEQWRIALLAFPEKPIFGYGPGNSSLVINDYIALGLADSDLYHKDAAYNMGHVHSQFFDTLLVQGLFGLIILLLILFYPAWVFIKYYKKNEVYANLGLILVMSYAIFSLTEIPFISDNFTSIYFIYMGVFLLNTLDDKSNSYLIRKNN